MKKIIITLILLFSLLPFQALAEIEKVAIPCKGKMCFYWWPKLPKIKGWNHDENVSIKFQANMQIPVKSNFRDAQTIIYAKAIYKLRMPQTKSLEQLISGDKLKFQHKSPLKINLSQPIKTKSGMNLISYEFFPTAKSGNWERVSYGEESDFYLIFTMSSNSKKAYDHSLPVY
ncbi:MAG: hypothetical protein ACJAUU_000533, partial [Rickettsiales bacterium]